MLRLELLGDLESARGGWEPLARQGGNVFSSWEWASCWWREFGDGRPLRLTAYRDDGGEIAALLPLYLSSRRPVRTLRFLGHGPADQLGPVCAPELIEPVGRELRRGLAERFWDWDVFIADRLPGGHDWESLLESRRLESESSPLLRVDGNGWEDFLAARSSNFREQVRRRERKLAREHDLRFRLTTPDRFEQDFDTLVRLHDARWGEGSKAFGQRLERFHRAFASAALARGWLRLWIMEVNGSPVAAWYGFRYGGIESYYNSGRDRSWDSYRVGFVLLVHTIREAFNDGMLEYRMLRGGEEYKSRFASEDPRVDTVARSRGLAKVVSAFGSATRRAMPYRVRRRLARFAGS
jgi:CelD/BcsL family acetyltransferase involved in cellulose biosynthesis